MHLYKFPILGGYASLLLSMTGQKLEQPRRGRTNVRGGFGRLTAYFRPLGISKNFSGKILPPGLSGQRAWQKAACSDQPHVKSGDSIQLCQSHGDLPQRPPKVSIGRPIRYREQANKLLLSAGCKNNHGIKPLLTSPYERTYQNLAWRLLRALDPTLRSIGLDIFSRGPAGSNRRRLLISWISYVDFQPVRKIV